MGVTPLIVRNLRKEFGGVVAVDDASFEVRKGEVVALVGDNGAGKSTLVKLISGVYSPSGGEILINGDPARSRSHARDRGIEVVYQDLALADWQPVYMNLFLGRERVRRFTGQLDRKLMAAEAQRLIDELDVRIPGVRTAIRHLSGGQRQAVAIARATHWAKGLVLLDEPTAALGVAETARVEDLIVSLKRKGLAVLVVSHNLDQVYRIADRVIVMRRGKHVATSDLISMGQNELVAHITGVAVSAARPGTSDEQDIRNNHL
ncbi:ATP-binding cassette domain-containing protein [Luethyella okanaganae]|uniref:ATP-binding cassette domain-containing protein n=1 Tax=Luethyella okanaganae TaxID=69372 RepID=A0ABW1VFL5_9MICO